MKLRYISYGIVCLFLFFSIGMDITELYSAGGATAPFIKYHENSVIRIVCLISIVLQLIIFAATLFSAVKHEKNDRYLLQSMFIQIASVIILFLVWFVLYYGSTFYYGEVRDKQSLFSSVNSFGIIGTSILLTYSLTLLKSFRGFKTNGKIFYTFAGFAIIITIQSIIFHLLEDKWRLWSS
jgi:hypothetical protein